jgi:hypothetical protein
MSWKNIQLKWAALGLAALSSVGAVADEAKLRHEGVATCASSLCHGSSQPLKAYDNALQNEYTTWTQFDPHSNAYKVLLNKQSQEIARRILPVIRTPCPQRGVALSSNSMMESVARAATAVRKSGSPLTTKARVFLAASIWRMVSSLLRSQTC